MLDVRRPHIALLVRANFELCFITVVKDEEKILDIQHDVRDILVHATQGGKLVLNALDPNGNHRRAFKG